MHTIRELCKHSGLSRTALLYYDSLGLLTPVARSEANYRLYSEESLRRLERICIYREAGVPLEEIRMILSQEEPAEILVLERTMALLNMQARDIREKQRKVAVMLEGVSGQMRASTGLDKEFVLSALGAIGVGEEELRRFHALLERRSPDAHRMLLENLGFPEHEVLEILAGIPSDHTAIEERKGTS